MKSFKLMVGVPLLAAVLGFSTAPALASDFLFKTEVSPGYCHMQYPALDDNFDRPRLQSMDTLDIVDYYGPCNHDPLGREAVENQRIDAWISSDGGGDEDSDS